jgi:hypothetical protein
MLVLDSDTKCILLQNAGAGEFLLPETAKEWRSAL